MIKQFVKNISYKPLIKGIIYFLESNNLLKVGFTTNLDRRLNQHKQSNRNLKLINTVESYKEVELYFHKNRDFININFGREWYDISEYENIKNKIENLTALVNNGELSLKPTDIKTVVPGKLFPIVKTALDYKVVFFLVDYTNRKDNSLIVNVDLKQKLAIGLGYSIKAIEKSLSNLVAVNAITPIGRGKYLINPELIFIGGTVNIHNRIEEYNNFRNTYLDKKNKND